MSANTTSQSDSGAQRRARPRSVDLALGAILLRCLLALAATLALYGAKDEIRRDTALRYPDLSPAALTERVDNDLRSNVWATVIFILLVLLIAKFIRDGRNWARWLYAFVAFLVAGDVLRITGFFTGDNLLFRLLSGFTGLAAIVAIVCLFSPSSSAYFRPAAGSGSGMPFRTLFGGRAAAAAAARNDASGPAADQQAGTAAAEPVSLTKSAKRSPSRRPNGSKRPAPRAKSRKQAAE